MVSSNASSNDLGSFANFAKILSSDGLIVPKCDKMD